MLVSVHLPKTAGTSFRALLEEHYGTKLTADYNDRPLHKPVWRSHYDAGMQYLKSQLSESSIEDVECIHGHFWPLKYRSLQRKGAAYVAWLREPVERLASHYYYWQRAATEDLGPLHRQMIEQEWSFERFCLGPELRNIYSRFLWGFGLARFDFVGITEFYEEDLSAFCQRFWGHDAPLSSSENINTSRKSDQNYIQSDELRLAIETHHAADVKLYKEALRLRAVRSAQAVMHKAKRGQ